MWIGHFEVKHENCIYLTNSSKFNVTISMYPLNSYTEGKYRYHTNVNILAGKKENIENFLKAIRKDKRCISFQGTGNVYLSNIKLKSSDYHTTNYYTPKIFLLRPVVHKDGKEDWYFGAWERGTITEMLKTFEKHFDVKLLSLKQTDFAEIFIPQVMPKMTEKQKEALRLAIEKGYYDYPRRIDLQGLAKFMKINRVTFQEHLKKAESKVLPKIFGGA